MDIHCGGVDNIFPHHTNEIAQSEAYTGHKWCNYWFHVNHLNTKSGKMSKSDGEFLTVSLLAEKGYDPMAYRLFCLQSHYRKPLEFSWEALDNAATAYDKLKNRIGRIYETTETNTAAADREEAASYRDKFEEALANDLNTSSAITVLYDMLKADISDASKRELVQCFDSVLSLGLSGHPAVKEADAELTAYVEEKIAERKEAKAAKDFARADEIRDELAGKGILLKDTREGTIWSM